MELSGVYLAASAHRSRPHQADGRTDCTSADPSAPGPTYWKDTSTYAYRDSSRERARGSPATESCVRYPLLFSRTTRFGKEISTDCLSIVPPVSHRTND